MGLDLCFVGLTQLCTDASEKKDEIPVSLETDQDDFALPAPLLAWVLLHGRFTKPESLPPLHLASSSPVTLVWPDQRCLQVGLFRSTSTTLPTMAMYSRIFPTPRSSEKKHDVTGQPKESSNIVADEKKPSKHRGRRGAGDYPTAERVPVELEGVTEGQACPCGCGGRLSGKKDSVILQFVG